MVCALCTPVFTPHPAHRRDDKGYGKYSVVSFRAEQDDLQIYRLTLWALDYNVQGGSPFSDYICVRTASSHCSAVELNLIKFLHVRSLKMNFLSLNLKVQFLKPKNTEVVLLLCELYR